MRQDLSHLAAFCALVAHASLSAAAPASDTFDKRGGNPDYVIVGGGSAGFVLAEQLSRNPSVSVVLLESGPQNADIDAINIPGYAAMLLDTPSTYNYSCQPDPNIGGRRQALHQGRGFGGGSAVNYMGSAIGAPSVYDEWAAISGDPGLRWENIQKAFKAVYHYTEYPLDYEPYVNEDAYGTGPVELTSPTDNLGFVQELAAAWRSVLDIEWADPNDGTGVGLFSGTTNVRASNKTRVFAAQAFGWQLAGRPNAQQLYNAEVIKIGFTGTRATSVTYVNPITGARKTLYPKEVILSAGAFGSPKVRDKCALRLDKEGHES
jgi:choline dehydrogenase-like flavoprotein